MAPATRATNAALRAFEVVLGGGSATDCLVSSSSVESKSVTLPASPSTRMVWPDLMRVVATPVPRTAGIPYSRATIEPWARTPPTSVTSPRACEKSGVHAGVVVEHTRIVPGSIREKSAVERTTLAGAGYPAGPPGDTG